MREVDTERNSARGEQKIWVEPLEVLIILLEVKNVACQRLLEARRNRIRGVVRSDKFSLPFSKVLNKKTLFGLPFFEVVIDFFDIEIDTKNIQHIFLVNRIEVKFTP